MVQSQQAGAGGYARACPGLGLGRGRPWAALGCSWRPVLRWSGRFWTSREAEVSVQAPPGDLDAE